MSCRKKKVCCLQGLGHRRGLYDRNMHVSTTSAEMLTLLQSYLVSWYILMCSSVVWKNETKPGLLCSMSRSQWNFKMLINVCLDNINYWTFYDQTWYCDASSWDWVRRLVCCLQGQDLSEGFIWSNYDFLSCELLILLQPNLVWWHKSDCLLKRLDCFVVFKVKVTAKVQNF